MEIFLEYYEIYDILTGFRNIVGFRIGGLVLWFGF